MSVKVENIEKNVVQLEVSVSAEEFEKALEKAFNRNKSQFNIPGFRKGKAPRAIIEKKYGEGIFFEDALNILVPQAYEDAVLEAKIEPVDSPEYDVKEIGKGKELVFTAKVTVKPDVELGQYVDLGITKAKVRVTKAMIDEEVKKDAERASRIVTIEDPEKKVESGDIAVIDFKGFVDDVAFEGGEGTNYSLTIGSNTFIPGFEDQIIGAKKDDEIDVNVTFPEDYGQETLAGKPAVFKVKVNEIKVKEIPEIDDEFAQDISEFDTLEEYKADVKSKISERQKNENQAKYENEVIEKIVENSKIDLPQAMIERRIDAIVNDMDMRLRYQGMDINQYLQYMGMAMEDMRSQMAERAEKEVRAQLCLEKIAETEGFTASEEEIDEEINKMAEQYGQPADSIKSQLRDQDMEYIKKDICIKKTVDFITK